MKKALTLCLIFVLAVSFTACGKTDETADTDISESVITDAASGGTQESSATVPADSSSPSESKIPQDISEVGAGSDLSSESKEERKMQISVTDGTHTVIFELNGSPAAKSLYDQLPLTIDVENYSDDEKIFYPEKLDTSEAVNADAKKGTLAYFSPWGDVVMYYKDFGSYSGLYELGQAISGSDEIESLSGTIDITAVE